MNSKSNIPVPMLSLADVSPLEDAFFYAGKLEDLPSSFKEYSSSHRHSYFAVFFFIKGDGIHTIDFQDYSITPGSLFFLKAGQVHSWKFFTPVQGFALKISPEFYSKYISYPTSLQDFPFFTYGPSLAQISIRNVSQICLDFERLIQEGKGMIDKRVQHAISLLIFCQIQKEYEVLLFQENGKIEYCVRKETEIHSNQASQIKELFQYLENHFSEKRNTSFYARKLGLSPASLNRLCQNILGKSIKTIIHDRVILEVKRLLLHSDLNVLEICRNLNFTDPAYFSRYVKIQTGLSPLQIREEKRKVQSFERSVHLQAR